MIFLLACTFGVLIILVALALSQVSDVNKRVNALLHELHAVRKLESRLDRVERDLSALAGAPQHAPVKSGPAPPAMPAAVPSHAPDRPQQAPVETPAAPAEGFPPPPIKPSRTRAEWEAFVGGKLLNRIGAFALIIGIGFFLKYAVDNEWISETVRVLIGAGAGIACLAVARRTHKRGMRIFAQGLVGSGIAILYLSVYASFNYYHLVPQWAAFALMSLVTVVTFWHGAAYESLAVGVLGWAGGFLTPFLLSTAEVNETGLFGYISLLDAGILAMVFRKREWALLEPLAMGATWVMYYAWHVEYYTGDRLPAALFFISLFWIFFHTADIVRNLRPSALWPAAGHLVPVVNAGSFYLMLYTILEKEPHGWTAAATLAVAALYFGTGVAGRRRGPEAGAARARDLLTVAVLVAIATTIQYGGFTTIMLWSLEAAILGLCGARWNFRYLLTAAVLFLTLAAVKFTDTPGALFFSYPGDVDPLFNLRNLTYLVWCAALTAVAHQYGKYTDRSARILTSALESAAGVVFFICITVIVNDFYSLQQSLQPRGAAHDLLFRRLLAIASTWTIFSLPFVWAGLRFRKNTVITPGLGAFLLAATLVAIRGIAFSPIEAFTPLLNVRVATFLLVVLGAVIHSALIDPHREDFDWLPDVRNYLSMAVGVLIFSLLTGETRDYFGRSIGVLEGTAAAPGDAVKIVQLQNLQQLSLSGIWLVYSAVLMAVGIWKSSRGLRFFSIGLFGLTILKIFIYDLSFLETLYRIFSFIGLGLILLAVSYAYQRYKHLLFGGQPGERPPAAGS